MDLIGKRYGRLTVLEKLEKSKHGYFMWNCICDCGNTKIVNTQGLNSGHTQSCGCLLKQRSNEHKIKHGQSYTSLYSCWKSIKQRCLNPKNPFYKNYGGRGINICSEWLNFNSFLSWALTSGYDKNLTIDRIDVNGNYEPSNCRWVDRKMQSNNRRCSKLYVINGVANNLKDWCKIYGRPYTTTYLRIQKGWSVIDALTVPSKSKPKDED